MPPVWPGPIGCLAMVRESTLLQLFVVLFEFCRKIRNKTWFTCVTSIQVLVFQMKKWTFSTPEGRCVPYTYGGCRGTQNLFSRCTLISSFCHRNVIRGEFDALTFVKRLKYFLILEISNKYDWQIVEVISNVMTTARLNVLHDARQSQNPAPRSALFLFNLDRWCFSSYDDQFMVMVVFYR